MLKCKRKKTALILIVTAIFTMSALFVGCGGKSSKKESEGEELGSLKREFTLVDEQGRKSGQLIIGPSGAAELKDANGETMATFSLSGSQSPSAAEKPAEAAPEKAEEKEVKEEKEDKTEEAKE